MNKFNKLRLKAKQTLKIIDLIEEGLTAKEIVYKLRIDRQLVDYYMSIFEE